MRSSSMTIPVRVSRVLRRRVLQLHPVVAPIAGCVVSAERHFGRLPGRTGQALRLPPARLLRPGKVGPAVRAKRARRDRNKR